MEVLTIETYYSILEKCTLEAFETLKLKEHYPSDGAKAIWDVSSLRIEKGKGILTERDIEVFKREYILDSMRVTFLTALHRYCEDFEIKNLITKSFFYKKCYESLLFKTSQSELWQKPDFGFNIDKEPCILTFIWNMRIDIESRSKEQITKSDTHHKYLQSFNSELFKNITTKIKVDGTNNSLFINLNDLLETYDKELTETISLNDYQNDLLKFNKRMFFLVGKILKLYKSINNYKETEKPSYLTKRDLLEIEVFTSFKNIKDLYSDLIFEKVRHNKIEIASDIQYYCISILKKTERILNDSFFISIEESPLNDNYKEISFELKQAIDIDRIKFLNEVKKENENIKVKTTNPKKIESEYWFIIGLKFATGELNKLIKANDNNFTKVAKELGNEKGYRPYISETYNNTTKTDKNIYSKPKKIKSIYDYCTENKIQMISTFIDAYNLNESI